MGLMPDYRKMMLEIGKQITEETMADVMKETETMVSKMVAEMVNNVLMTQIGHYENIELELRAIKEKLGVQ